MSSLDSPAPTVLSPGAQRMIQTAARKAGGPTAPLAVNHWLLALLERYGPMAETLTTGVEAKVLRDYAGRQLAEGQAGVPLDAEAVTARAAARARARGKQTASERDLAAVILAAAGYPVADEMSAPAAKEIAPVPAQTQPGGMRGATEAAWRPRAARPTPTLDRFGRDLTREAADGKLSPMIGRAEEVRLIIETLCRRTKRNPVLVGPAGVGKTAIIEGLAQRIVRGEVPALLRGARVVALQPSTLIAGVESQPQLLKRMEAIIQEAGQEGLLLFVDEAHSLVGAGGEPGASDMASLLKPPLARGEIACIAATTDYEYREFIESDPALERRFQPLRVQELSAEQTLAVLLSLQGTLAEARGVAVPEAVLRRLLDLAERYLRNRHFPDKAVDLLEQCVAHALAEGQAEVTAQDAEAVTARLVGMPPALPVRIADLRETLGDRRLLTPDEANALLGRLEVSLSDLDMRPDRPNAVALLLSRAAAEATPLAETLAETLYGGKERVVTIDLSRMTEAHSLSMLIGSPPGYVGYSETLPIHQITQMPWCVLVCENVHACHPLVREVLQQGLAKGLLTDASGRRVYLSDTVVLLTAPLEGAARRAMGLRHQDAAPGTEARGSAVQALGPEFVDQCDFVFAGVPEAESAGRREVPEALLSQMNERYGKRGLSLTWDAALAGWLDAQAERHANSRAWERLMDERLGPLLVPYLPQGNLQEPLRLRIQVEGETLHVTLAPTGEEKSD